MSRLSVVVLTASLSFIADAYAIGPDPELSGCYDIVAGTVSGMETSETSNQGAFSMTLRPVGPGRKRPVAIAGTESAVVSVTAGAFVIGYTLTDFQRTGQMRLVGHVAGEPLLVDTCIAKDGSTQPIFQYTIDVVPESGTGRFSGLHSAGGMTLVGTVEYCGYREDFSVVNGGAICF